MERNPLVYAATKRLAQFIFSFFYKIECERGESLPTSGPAIILPKHQYWTDIPITSLSFEPPLYFVAKKELFRLPLIRAYLLSLGGIPVNRADSIQTLTSFKRLLSLLRRGEIVVIFPEGKYYRGQTGPGKSRLLELILRLQSELNRRIPFIPVGIRYRERRRWRRSVEVRAGPHLFADLPSESFDLTGRIMEQIRVLSRLDGDENPGHGSRLQRHKQL
jgi:1-acyl-sn-glycerol-3-phosphate acyltransferase